MQYTKYYCEEDHGIHVFTHLKQARRELGGCYDAVIIKIRCNGFLRAGTFGYRHSMKCETWKSYRVICEV